jgi:hypothetical protein
MEGVEWIGVSQDFGKGVGFFECGNETSAVIKCRKFLGSKEFNFSIINLPHGVNRLVG